MCLKTCWHVRRSPVSVVDAGRKSCTAGFTAGHHLGICPIQWCRILPLAKVFSLPVAGRLLCKAGAGKPNSRILPVASKIFGGWHQCVGFGDRALVSLQLA